MSDQQISTTVNSETATVPKKTSTSTSTSNLNLLTADNVTTSTASIQTGSNGCANCLDDGKQNVAVRKISQSSGAKPFPIRGEYLLEY